MSLWPSNLSVEALVVLPRMSKAPCLLSQRSKPSSLSALSLLLSIGYEVKLTSDQIDQDSYSDGGKYDGSALNDPVLHPPNPSAGGRYTNGPIWAEYLANTTGAVLMDYAVSGQVWHLETLCRCTAC